MSRYPKGWTPPRLTPRPDHRNKARWTEEERATLEIIAALSGVSPEADEYPEPEDDAATREWEKHRKSLVTRLEYKWAREPAMVENKRRNKNT